VPCLLLGYLTLSSDLVCVASNDGMMSEQFPAEGVEESCHGRSCSKRLLVGETETPQGMPVQSVSGKGLILGPPVYEARELPTRP
jgi:hypothetical protein